MYRGDLLHIGTAYVEVHTFKGKDYVAVRDFSTTTNALSKEILELEEENKKLNIKVASLEGEIKGLNYTIDKLHKELDECECSFGFESDEVGFWKREYKRLKKWIKDHCKGYGNLFPEDEMKRQRKKADKKRK